MKADSEIFELIRKMSRSEKGYFKKFSSLQIPKGENNYIKLFDAIDSSGEIYDEAAVKERFKNEKFVKQLSVTKNYLYKNLLKSLNSFHYGSSINRKMREGLLSVEVLSGKGLYKQAYKLLMRLKEAAEANEKLIPLLDIISFETYLSRILLKPAEYGPLLEKLSLEEDKILKQHINLRDYKVLSDRMILLTTFEGLFTQDEIKAKAEEIMSQPLLEDESRALSVQAKIFYNHLKGSYYMAAGDNALAHAHTARLVSLLELPGEKSYERTFNYIITLQNYLYLSIELNLTEETDRNLVKFKALLSENRESFPDPVFAEIMSRYYILKLMLSVKKNDRSFNEELPAAEMLYREKGELIYPEDRIILASLIARTYFFYGLYEKALEWTNIILNFPNPDVRPDVQTGSRIMNLIIHYELGNNDLLEYIIKSTYRYLLKRKKLFEFEKIIFGFLKKTTAVHNEKELTTLLKNLREKLKELSEKKEPVQSLEYEYILRWIERRLG